jgi:hypothetical protein
MDQGPAGIGRARQGRSDGPPDGRIATPGARESRRRANNALGAGAIACMFAAEVYVASRLEAHPATPAILAALVGAAIAAAARAAMLYRKARASEVDVHTP